MNEQETPQAAQEAPKKQEARPQERLRQVAQRDPAFRSEEVKALRKDLTRMLSDTGRPAKEAAAWANVAVDFAVVTARREGVAVRDVLNLAVRSDVDPKGLTLDEYMQRMFHATGANLNGEFDLGKMGSGAGTQYFGWGAYLAQAEDYARVYKDIKEKIGNLYTVEGPDDDVLLDWDINLFEQPQRVKESIGALLDELKENTGFDPLGKVKRFAEQVRANLETKTPYKEYRLFGT